jgi:hypothetical protein
LLVKLEHRLGRLLHRDPRVRSVHPIDVYGVGSEATERVADLAHDPVATPIARDLPVMPFDPYLGGDKDALAETVGKASLVAFDDGPRWGDRSAAEPLKSQRLRPARKTR